MTSPEGKDGTEARHDVLGEGWSDSGDFSLEEVAADERVRPTARDDRRWARELLDLIDTVAGYVARGRDDFFDEQDDRTFEAVQMRIINMGHAIGSMSREYRDRISPTCDACTGCEVASPTTTWRFAGRSCGGRRPSASRRFGPGSRTSWPPTPGMPVTSVGAPMATPVSRA